MFRRPSIEKQEQFIIKVKDKQMFLHLDEKNNLIFRNYILGAVTMDENNRRHTMRVLAERFDETFESVKVKNLNFVNIQYEN